MSSKKKPAAKSKPAPGPLLKLKFEKFPDKQVPVFFEVSKLCFYADFGFEQYEAASVAQLKQKITAAIKSGATPEPQWTHVIQVEFYPDRTYNPKDIYSGQFEVTVEHGYAIVRKGQVLYARWHFKPNERMERADEIPEFGKTFKCLQLPLVSPNRPGVWKRVFLATYDEQLFKQLLQINKVFDRLFEQLFISLSARNLPAWFGMGIPGVGGGMATKKLAEPKKALGKSFSQVREETSVTDPMAKLTSFVNAGRAAQQDVDQAIAKYKPPAGRKSKPKIGFSSAEVHFDGKIIELTPGPLPVSIRIPLLKHYPQMQSAHVLKDGRVQLVVGIMASDKPVYLSIDQLQQKLNKQPGPIAELFESDEPARKDKELVNA